MSTDQLEQFQIQCENQLAFAAWFQKKIQDQIADFNPKVGTSLFLLAGSPDNGSIMQGSVIRDQAEYQNIADNLMDKKAVVKPDINIGVYKPKPGHTYSSYVRLVQNAISAHPKFETLLGKFFYQRYDDFRSDIPDDEFVDDYDTLLKFFKKGGPTGGRGVGNKNAVKAQANINKLQEQAQSIFDKFDERTDEGVSYTPSDFVHRIGLKRRFYSSNEAIQKYKKSTFVKANVEFFYGLISVGGNGKYSGVKDEVFNNVASVDCSLTVAIVETNPSTSWYKELLMLKARDRSGIKFENDDGWEHYFDPQQSPYKDLHKVTKVVTIEDFKLEIHLDNSHGNLDEEEIEVNAKGGVAPFFSAGVDVVKTSVKSSKDKSKLTLTVESVDNKAKMFYAALTESLITDNPIDRRRQNPVGRGRHVYADGNSNDILEPRRQSLLTDDRIGRRREYRDDDSNYILGPRRENRSRLDDFLDVPKRGKSARRRNRGGKRAKSAGRRNSGRRARSLRIDDDGNREFFACENGNPFTGLPVAVILAVLVIVILVLILILYIVLSSTGLLGREGNLKERSFGGLVCVCLSFVAATATVLVVKQQARRESQDPAEFAELQEFKTNDGPVLDC